MPTGRLVRCRVFSGCSSKLHLASKPPKGPGCCRVTIGRPITMKFPKTSSLVWAYLTRLCAVGLTEAQSTSPSVYTVTTAALLTLPPMSTSPGAQLWGTQISKSDGTTEIVLGCDPSFETAPPEPWGDFVGATLTSRDSRRVSLEL